MERGSDVSGKPLARGNGRENEKVTSGSLLMTLSTGQRGVASPS
jgi:hypothetical protein